MLVAGEAVEPQSSYFLANRGFTEANPRLVAQAVAVLAQVSAWSKAHLDEVARLSAEATGLPLTPPAAPPTAPPSKWCRWATPSSPSSSGWRTASTGSA